MSLRDDYKEETGLDATYVDYSYDEVHEIITDGFTIWLEVRNHKLEQRCIELEEEIKLRKSAWRDCGQQ